MDSSIICRLQEDLLQGRKARYVPRTCSREQQFIFANDEKFESTFGVELRSKLVVAIQEILFRRTWMVALLNDAQDLCCLARLGVSGSIRQIAGPNEDNEEDIYNGPIRRVSFAILEVIWGQGTVRSEFAVFNWPFCTKSTLTF